MTKAEMVAELFAVAIEEFKKSLHTPNPDEEAYAAEDLANGVSDKASALRTVFSAVEDACADAESAVRNWAWERSERRAVLLAEEALEKEGAK